MLNCLSSPNSVVGSKLTTASTSMSNGLTRAGACSFCRPAKFETWTKHPPYPPEKGNRNGAENCRHPQSLLSGRLHQTPPRPHRQDQGRTDRTSIVRNE